MIAVHFYSIACILGASSAHDVATALKILDPSAYKFATRGGVHGALRGIANIQDGVTIDLRGLNYIIPFAGNRLVSVGGGQTIGTVYAALHNLGITISGGRSYDVGVGGSTLGNGWQWMSNEAGFGCDNVAEYEVVLSNGTIVIANRYTNAKLWKSLKGGGNNFGIVTSFVFRTMPMARIWTEDVLYSLTESQVPRLLSAAANFTSDPEPDPKATLFIAAVSAVYGIGWTLSFQPLTRLMTEASAARGGNVVGIGLPPPERLHDVQLTAAFLGAADYGRVSSAADQLLAECIAAVTAHGAYWPWVEMNHASHIQDPISTYGKENKAFVLDTASEYDPYAVFQNLMPGGCKLEAGCASR
ncbi:FAD binding domain-containing protein [Apiospora phragmitis]|uniref:FAD binding domain-containing protein n=1 Tax=Apiospora phragmitis TaxID=2905665 RepID=A0ABR1T2V4_9PEZI